MSTTIRRFTFGLITAVAFILTSAVSGVKAPAPDFAQAETVSMPSWSDVADRFPGCDAHREGVVAAAVVVVDSSAVSRRMSTDAAYAVNTDGVRANDVWVVGTC